LRSLAHTPEYAKLASALNLLHLIAVAQSSNAAKKCMKLPNGPKTPQLVQMLQWISSPMKYMEDCTQRYGDIFTLQLTDL